MSIDMGAEKSSIIDGHQMTTSKMTNVGDLVENTTTATTTRARCPVTMCRDRRDVTVPSQPEMTTTLPSGKRGTAVCPVLAKYALLFQFTQPAHLVILIMVIYVGFVVFPKETTDGIHEPGTLSSVLYIGSFATHFGSQMWMTFVSGIVLFFTIPRNVFGQVQRQLFPKYFFMNAILGFATLTAFVHQHPSSTWTIQQQTQVWALSVCFFAELVTRLYIVPSLLDTLAQRMAIEEEAGVGGEVGRHEPGVLRACPHYMALHRRFRRLHAACAAANMTAVACNGIHLYHLATKLCAL